MILTPRQTMLAVFALNAVLNGGMFARLPEVQKALGLTEGEYGLALAALSIGVLTSMQVAPRLTAALGMRRLMFLSFLVSSFAPPVFGLVPGFWALFVLTAAFGFVTSIAGAGMNVEADRIGRETGRPLMAQCHGTWSLVFMVTTAISAGLIKLGVTPLEQFVGLSVIMLGATFVIVRPMPESPASVQARPTSRFVLPSRITFLLMGYGLISVVVEIVLRNWAIVIVRDIFLPPGWIAALALPAFIATQTAGRFLSDRVAERIGVVALGRAFCVVTAIGILVLATAPNVWLALLACAIAGLGVSATYPITITAVARRGERPVTESVAAFIFLQNILAAAAPVAFGAIAGLSDPRFAVICLLPITVVSWFYARELSDQASGVSSSLRA